MGLRKKVMRILAPILATAGAVLALGGIFSRNMSAPTLDLSAAPVPNCHFSEGPLTESRYSRELSINQADEYASVPLLRAAVGYGVNCDSKGTLRDEEGRLMVFNNKSRGNTGTLYGMPTGTVHWSDAKPASLSELFRAAAISVVLTPVVLGAAYSLLKTTGNWDPNPPGKNLAILRKKADPAS